MMMNLQTSSNIDTIEQNFLACILYDDDSRRRFSGLVAPECFYNLEYGKIYQSMLDTAAQDGDVNPISLTKHNPSLKEHVHALVELGLELVVYSPHYLAHQIWEHYNNRRLVALADNVKEKLKDEKPSEVLSWCASEQDKIINPLDAVENTEDDVAKAYEAATSGAGRITQTGVAVIDDAVGGLDCGAMTLLAAHPGAGKTALALNISWRIATNKGKVLFFSAEEAKQPLWWRIFSMQTGMPVTAFRKGLSEKQKVEFQSKQDGIAKRPLKIIDSVCALPDLRAKVLAEHSETPVELVVIDSASMISAERGETEVEKANRIGWDVTRLAKELDIPILLLAHVNNEGIKSKAGGLTNIYGGQGLVKPAGMVFELRKNEKEVGKGVIIDGHISKNRYGEVGKVMRFDFVGEHMRFYGAGE